MIGILIRLTFAYFSIMTYVFIGLTFTVNPGYLPKWFKTPPTSEGYAPIQLLRIYNMRTWMANDIKSFDEFGPSADDIEINFEDEAYENHGSTSINLITETTNASVASMPSAGMEMQLIGSDGSRNS